MGHHWVSYLHGHPSQHSTKQGQRAVHNSSLSMQSSKQLKSWSQSATHWSNLISQSWWHAAPISPEAQFSLTSCADVAVDTLSTNSFNLILRELCVGKGSVCTESQPDICYKSHVFLTSIKKLHIILSLFYNILAPGITLNCMSLLPELSLP